MVELAAAYLCARGSSRGAWPFSPLRPPFSFPFALPYGGVWKELAALAFPPIAFRLDSWLSFDKIDAKSKEISLLLDLARM